MSERDYPVGHPAAGDYKGEAYADKFASYAYDFPEDHPARGGKNIADTDTPDGMRESQAKQTNRFVDLASVGSLPKLFDGKQPEPLQVAPEKLAQIYAARLAEDVSTPLSDEGKQAVECIVALGYDKADAIRIFDNYTVPVKAQDEAKG